MAPFSQADGRQAAVTLFEPSILLVLYEMDEVTFDPLWSILAILASTFA